MTRVWFRHLAGVETYIDVRGLACAIVIAAAHDEMRRHTEPPLRGWYLDRWQPLLAIVGHPARPGERFRRVDGPPLHRRLRMAWRRRARSGARTV